MVPERMGAGALSLGDGHVRAARDDFDEPKLAACWNFLRNPAEGTWSVEERPGWLTLHGTGTTLDDIGSPAFAGRRQQHFRCTVSALLAFRPVQEGEEAGLTVYRSERFHYEIALAYMQGRSKVILRRRIGSLWKIEREENYGGGEIILEIVADPSRYSFYYLGTEGERVPFGTGECSLLSTEVAGGFTGVYFGLYATGNGRVCSVPAAFDWFEYVPLDRADDESF